MNFLQTAIMLCFLFRQIKLIDETCKEGDSKNILIKQLISWSLQGKIFF